MSWLELDDGILDHPKFIRVVKLAGSEAVHLWLGIKSYCAKHLTDGQIPADMLDEVRGPSDKRKRAAALRALYTVGLLEEREGSVWMHDYLHWSSSRATVLDRREKARERKARSRGSHAVTTHVTDDVTPPAVTNPRARVSPTTPPPHPSTPLPVCAPLTPEPEWDERETPIPLGFAKALVGKGVHVEIAEALKVDAESVAHELEQFEQYWAIGGGTGKRRRHWALKAREWVREKAGQNKLTPVGAIAHARLSESDSARIDAAIAAARQEAS